MVLQILSSLIFPPPPSIFVTTMSVVSLVSLAITGFKEIKGKHLQYSKFWNVNVPQKNVTRQVKFSSRLGMFLLYAPAFLAGLASFFIYPNEDLRFLFVKSCLTIHFFKRLFEVLFIHKYSGQMVLDSTIIISLSYFISTATMVYTQSLSQSLQEPQTDLKIPGLVLFLMGISGNFYHHYILSNLRGPNEKEYKIPKGGLFGLVICPHYFFEILGFVGITFMSQTFYALCFTLGTTFYLMGRSYATRRWYLSKFDDFPQNFKALFPFVF